MSNTDTTNTELHDSVLTSTELTSTELNNDNDNDSAKHNNNGVISYITLAVSSLPIMRSFYDGLGFSMHKHSDDHPYVMYKSGGLVLALYPKQLLAQQSGCNLNDMTTNSASSFSLNVESSDAVEYMLKQSQILGATLMRERFEPEWGGCCGYFKDPEGNLWEIVWHPKFVF